MALAIAGCVACAVVAGLAIACGGGEEVPPAATSTATVAASPNATPEVETQPRLIFLRPALNGRDRFGVIYMSDDLAGSNVVQVTPADVRASLVGLSEQDGAAILYYLAARETSSDLTLEARDLGTGATTTLASVQLATAASISPRLAVRPSGSLSPDGRYVALSHRDGLDLLDLTTNRRPPAKIAGLPGRPTAPRSPSSGRPTPTWRST
jgi:hypothetical protein